MVISFRLHTGENVEIKPHFVLDFFGDYAPV